MTTSAISGAHAPSVDQNASPILVRTESRGDNLTDVQTNLEVDPGDLSSNDLVGRPNIEL